MAAVGILERLKGVANQPIVISGASTAAIQVANLVTSVVLARALGPAMRGHVAALSGLSLTVCVLTGVSLADAVVFWAARQIKDVRLVLGTAFLLLLVTMIASIGLLIAVFPLVLDMGGTKSLGDVAPWILYAGISQAALFVQTLARTINRLQLWFWLRLMATWNYALIVLALALTVGMTSRLAGVSICAGALVTTAVGAWFLGAQVFPLAASGAMAKRLLSYGARLHPSSMATVVREQLDKVVLILIAPASEVGKYVVALALGSLIVSAGHSIDQVVFPRLSRILKFDERRAAFLRMAMTLGPLILLGAPLLMAVSPWLARLMFGRAFVDEPWLIVCGVAVGCLHAIKVLATIGLKIENKPGVLGGIETAGSFVGLVALVVCVKLIGIFGAPLGSGLGAALSLGMMVWVNLRQYGLRPKLEQV
jgi:O-antigen/teichoic acid export membrane protein